MSADCDADVFSGLFFSAIGDLVATYIQKLSIKVVRRKHDITFMAGETISAVLDALQKVPKGSVVDEVDTIESGLTTITFHDERRLHEE